MAASGYTVYTSYILVPESLSLGYGYSKSIHCNYIKSLQLSTDPYLQEIVLNFSNITDFKFLNDDINNGTGYTAHKICAIVQLVDNSNFSTLAEVKPTASQWKIYDVTSQITTHTTGNPLTPTELTQQAFKVPLKNYELYYTYNLHDYITYPTKEVSADSDLCFGDETFFMGNVTTDIKAIAYTTDIPIQLNLNEFNSSTNATWKQDKVSISEIGIYDANKNLVAIGKLNNPIQKDSTIARTLVFAVDF